MDLKFLRSIILIFLLTCMVTAISCTKNQSAEQDKKTSGIFAGDKLTVGKRMINLHVKGEGVSDIIDIQDSGKKLTVLGVQPKWIKVEANSKGLLREAQGKFTGWITVADAKSLKITRRAALGSSNTVPLSGKRTPGSSKSARELCGNKGSHRQLSEKDSQKLCGRTAKYGKSKAKRKGYGQNDLESFELTVKSVIEISYFDLLTEINKDHPTIDERFLGGITEDQKMITIEFKLKNPNKKLFPTNPANWLLIDKSKQKRKFQHKLIRNKFFFSPSSS